MIYQLTLTKFECHHDKSLDLSQWEFRNEKMNRREKMTNRKWCECESGDGVTKFQTLIGG